jgi:hypothetical protein
MAEDFGLASVMASTQEWWQPERDLGFWVEGMKRKKLVFQTRRGEGRRREKERGRRRREPGEAGGAASSPGFSNRVNFTLFALFFFPLQERPIQYITFLSEELINPYKSITQRV